MKTILKANKNVISLLSEQKFDNNISYRVMDFVVAENNKSGNLYLFNNMTKEVVSLDEAEAKAFQQFDVQNKTIKELIKRWYIVPQNFQEAKTFDQIRDLYLSIRQTETDDGQLNSFTILPTTDCNAHCYYCYEQGCKKYTMDEKTAHDVANFIKNNISNNFAKLRWFGGEPLLAMNKMDIVCQDLLYAGIKITSDIISNGYFFDEATVKKARNLWNLQLAQITLDGTEEVYNSAKNYVSNKAPSPFFLVMENIKNLLNYGVQVHVRINLSGHNEADVVDLINYLSQRFNAYKNNTANNCNGVLTVYVHSLFQDLLEGEQTVDKDNKLEMLYKRETEMEKLLRDNNLGMKIGLPRHIRVNHCMADSGCSAVILPDGGLALCEHHVDGDANFGSIYQNYRDENMISKWRQKHPIQEKCKTCQFYPSCFRLKNCPNVKEKCSEAYQNWEINKLHDALWWL